MNASRDTNRLCGLKVSSVTGNRNGRPSQRSLNHRLIVVRFCGAGEEPALAGTEGASVHAADGTRTRNHWIDSPQIADSKSNSELYFTPTEADGLSAGRGDQAREGGNTDPELAALVAAWPLLPEPIRRAMLALIGVGA